MDPNDYATRGPRKPRKGGSRGARSRSSMSGRKRRGRGGTRVVSYRSPAQPVPPRELPKQVNLYENQPVLLRDEDAGPSELVLVETVPLGEDLDFPFVAGVLRDWNERGESDVALWTRMESMVRGLAFSLCFPES